MVNANSKLQVNNNLLKIIVILTFVVFLNSCGSPTTVITRGDTSVIDKERIITVSYTHLTLPTKRIV